jgi:nucleobase:cation symporter-1, NCS1 family
MSSWLQKLEVKPTDDEYESIATSRWGNKDVYPIPHDKRTYGWLAFWAYWGTCGISISSWTIGSSLIGIGLTAGQACGVVVLYALVSMTTSTDHDPGDRVCARVVERLSQWYPRRHASSWFRYAGKSCIRAVGIVLRDHVERLSVVHLLWYVKVQLQFRTLLMLTRDTDVLWRQACSQSRIEIRLTVTGMAFVIILNALSPSFLRMENTLPLSAGITTPQLVGFILFIVLYFPIIWFVPPHRVQKYLIANLVVSSATLLGIMGWAIAENGGVGNLVSPQVEIPRSQVGFLMMQGISSVAGTYAGGSDRVSDWTRFAKTRHSPTFAQLTALPITVTAIALVGIITTSAFSEILGSLEWNPMITLQLIQATRYTAACRAGTFFAGVGLLCVIVFINYTQNNVSSGMDLAMLLPRYISRRRGSMLFAILGVLANPWRFLTQASTFITVLSSFGVFMSPAAAILVTDFWIVRRRKWNIPDLYSDQGIYWFWNGLNWRAFTAYFLGMVWALPGFIMAMGGPDVGQAWYRVYQLCFFIGYFLSGGLFWALNTIFPPPGLGVHVDIGLDWTAAGERYEQETPESSEAVGEKIPSVAASKV